MSGIKAAFEAFDKGNLHSGSKHGSKVTSKKQAAAIGFSENKKNPAGGDAMSAAIAALKKA